MLLLVGKPFHVKFSLKFHSLLMLGSGGFYAPLPYLQIDTHAICNIVNSKLLTFRRNLQRLCLILNILANIQIVFSAVGIQPPPTKAFGYTDIPHFPGHNLLCPGLLDSRTPSQIRQTRPCIPFPALHCSAKTAKTHHQKEIIRQSVNKIIEK